MHNNICYRRRNSNRKVTNAVVSLRLGVPLVRTRPNAVSHMNLGVTVVPGGVNGSERGAYGDGGGGMVRSRVCCCGVWLR